MLQRDVILNTYMKKLIAKLTTLEKTNECHIKNIQKNFRKSVINFVFVNVYFTLKNTLVFELSISKVVQAVKA